MKRPGDKELAKKKQKSRMKVANLVARSKEIDRNCVICGNLGKIVHNIEDPYYITFICDECKKDDKKYKLALTKRRDIRESLEKRYLHSNLLSDKQVREIVNNYMHDYLTIKDYCLKINITRYAFNRILKIYDQLYPEQNINDLVIHHAYMILGNKTYNRRKNQSL